MTADQPVALIEAQARVVALSPGLAWVETERRSACGSCPSSAGCATPVLGRLAGSRVSRLAVQDPLGLSLGEQVVIGIPAGVLTRAAALAYLFPPVALVLAAGAAASLGAGDLGSAASGALGLALGLLATRRMTGGMAGHDPYRPVLVRRRLPMAGAGAWPDIAFTVNLSTRGTTP